MAEANWAIRKGAGPQYRAGVYCKLGQAMKKWLAIFIILLLAIGGAAVWLAGKGSVPPEETGEIRLEVNDVF